ncbi:hypothetical protein V8C86DRAFT_2932094 [Haematococcus lacustris]
MQCVQLVHECLHALVLPLLVLSSQTRHAHPMVRPGLALAACLHVDRAAVQGDQPRVGQQLPLAHLPHSRHKMLGMRICFKHHEAAKQDVHQTLSQGQQLCWLPPRPLHSHLAARQARGQVDEVRGVANETARGTLSLKHGVDLRLGAQAFQPALGACVVHRVLCFVAYPVHFGEVHHQRFLFPLPIQRSLPLLAARHPALQAASQVARQAGCHVSPLTCQQHLHRAKHRGRQPRPLHQTLLQLLHSCCPVPDGALIHCVVSLWIPIPRTQQQGLLPEVCCLTTLRASRSCCPHHHTGRVLQLGPQLVLLRFTASYGAGHRGRQGLVEGCLLRT